MSQDTENSVISEKQGPLDVNLVNQASGPTPIFGAIMVFTTVAFLFWGNVIGLFGPEGTLTIGIIILCLVPLFVISARELVKNKALYFAGNIQLIFCFYFATVSGVINVLQGFGVTISPVALGTHFLIAGLLLLFTLPALKHASKIDLLINLLSAIALIIFFIGVCGVATVVMNIICAWIFFVIGCLGLYTVSKALLSLQNAE